MLLKNAFLVWLIKIKQAVAVLCLWIGHYCSLCWWRQILIIYFNGNHHQNCWKKWKNPQLIIIDIILVSKYWGINAVLHTVDFCPWRFFCWSFKIRAVSCSKRKKTFRSKCDINFLKFAHPAHSCLLGNFSIIVEGCSWLFICSDDDIYSLYCFIS